MTTGAARILATGVRGEMAAEALRSGLTIELPVAGASMLPLLRTGDVLTIVPARASSLAKNDLAFAVREDGTRVIHRVIATAPLTTRGDSCGGPDGPLAEVLGRVIAVTRFGVRVRLDGVVGRALSLASRYFARLRRYPSRAAGASSRSTAWP
jgi:hypothetical protein